MIPYIKYRLGLILGDLASTVYCPKGDFSIFKCNFFIFCPILMGFFHCIPHEKFNTIGHKRHDLSITVTEKYGVQKWPRPNF